MPTASPAGFVSKSRAISDFHGDFVDLAHLVEDAWSQNHFQSLVYTPEFFRSHFDYPGAAYQLAPTIYKENRMAAFIAAFPRRVSYRGMEQTFLSVSFLSVAAQYQKSGLGVILWNEVVRRARQAGYAGVVNFCIDGDSMNGMMLAGYKRMGVVADRIFPVHYMTRLIMPKGATATQEQIDDSWLERFMHAAKENARDCQLRRVWTMEEARWQCQRRTDAVVASLSAGDRSGFLTGNLMPIPNGNGAKCLLIEDVLLEDLLLEERRQLINDLLARAAAFGARMAILPLLGYFDVAPFSECRFVKSARLLHAYMGLLTVGEMIESVDSFYLDVF